jgi:hypothetical protein
MMARTSANSEIIRRLAGEQGTEQVLTPADIGCQTNCGSTTKLGDVSLKHGLMPSRFRMEQNQNRCEVRNCWKREFTATTL